jgi:hypothetical protein
MSESMCHTESEHMPIEQFENTIRLLNRKVGALMWSKRGIGRGGQNYVRFAKSVTRQFDYFNRHYTSVVLNVGIMPVVFTAHILKRAKQYLHILTSVQTNNQTAGICPVNAAAEPIMVAQTTLTKTIAIINALIQTHITEFKRMSIGAPLGLYMREYLAKTFPQLV